MPDKDEAFAAAIEALCKRYPLEKLSITDRRQRSLAVWTAKAGGPKIAVIHATAGGIPADELWAIHALIYG